MNSLFHALLLVVVGAYRSAPRLEKLRRTISATRLAAVSVIETDPLLQKVVVVGGGPAGLASAIMLAKRGYTDVEVFERLGAPGRPDDEARWADFTATDRSYNIGINGRGQRVLDALGALPTIQKYCVECVGRCDWSPNDPIDSPKETMNNRRYNPFIIQRERLTACLVDEIQTKYNDTVSLHFEVECQEIQWHHSGTDAETCQLSMVGKDGVARVVDSSFVIGAEGGGRGRSQTTVRDAMERDGAIEVVRYEDKNVRVYRTIPLVLADKSDGSGKKKWRGDLNYSARTKSDVNLDALPTKAGTHLGVVLYRPWDTQIKDLATAADAKRFFANVFPQFLPFVRDGDLERFAQQKDLKLPIFSYARPVIHRGSTACLVGDSIHTVKPYFGVGLNSAFEDVITLDAALEETRDHVPAAMVRYSALRAQDARAIVQMSQSLDGGFLTFVLPLIIDSILNKLAPWAFSPNTIAAMQNPDVKFRHVQRRKTLDRVLQVALGSTFVATMVKVATAVFAMVAKFAATKLRPV